MLENVTWEHKAGILGENGHELKLISYSNSSYENRTLLEFESTLVHGKNAVVQHDIIQFDGVKGLHAAFCFEKGHKLVEDKRDLQVVVVKGADCNDGRIYVEVSPMLTPEGNYPNINEETFKKGIKAKVLPSHAAGFFPEDLPF